MQIRWKILFAEASTITRRNLLQAMKYYQGHPGTLELAVRGHSLQSSEWYESQWIKLGMAVEKCQDGHCPVGASALAQGIVPFLVLHQAVWQQQQRRGHDFEFSKPESIAEKQIRGLGWRTVNFAKERQCSHK